MKNSKLWRWWNDFMHRFWAETLFLMIAAFVLVLIPSAPCQLCGFLMFVLFLIGAVVDYVGWKRSSGGLCILLAASILFSQMPVHAQTAPPPDPSAPSGQSDDPRIIGPCMCIMVLVVGTVVVYQLVKFCKAHLPPPVVNPDTNNWPTVTNSIPTNGIPTNMPPITVYPSDTSGDAAMGQRSFTMSVTVAADGSLAVSPAVNAYWDQSWNTLTYGQWTNALFAPWRSVPYIAASSPQPPAPGSLQTSYTGGVLSVTEQGQPTRTIVLYRSADLLNWSPVSTNIWSARFTHVMAIDADAPEQAAFYKVQ